MKIGLHLPQLGRVVTPDLIVDIAQRAEAAGFDDVWASDHIAVPEGMPAFFPEPVPLLSLAAGYTNRVGLGTSVIIAAYRNPMQMAKQWATLDWLAPGRTILGVGAGLARDRVRRLWRSLRAAGRAARRLHRRLAGGVGRRGVLREPALLVPRRAGHAPAAAAGPYLDRRLVPRRAQAGGPQRRLAPDLVAAGGVRQAPPAADRRNRPHWTVTVRRHGVDAPRGRAGQAERIHRCVVARRATATANAGSAAAPSRGLIEDLAAYEEIGARACAADPAVPVGRGVARACRGSPCSVLTSAAS